VDAQKNGAHLPPLSESPAERTRISLRAQRYDPPTLGTRSQRELRRGLAGALGAQADETSR
jgi:hypothetical protein